MKKRSKLLYVIGILSCLLSVVGLISSGQVSFYVGIPLFLVFAAMGYISIMFVIQAEKNTKTILCDFVDLLDSLTDKTILADDYKKESDAYRLNFCKMRKKAKMYKEGYNSLLDVINALIDENIKLRMDNYKPSTGTKNETIGYQCLHCGRIFKIKARHKCNGTYRKRGLSFKEIG